MSVFPPTDTAAILKGSAPAPPDVPPRELREFLSGGAEDALTRRARDELGGPLGRTALCELYALYAQGRCDRRRRRAAPAAGPPGRAGAHRRPPGRAGEGGRWVGTAAGYDEVYVLDVRSGDDSVEGVRVDGPDIHVFTAPTAGLTVDSTMPLRVMWDADQTADSASIDTEELDRVSISDTGDYTLAAGALKAERDKGPGEHHRARAHEPRDAGGRRRRLRAERADREPDLRRRAAKPGAVESRS